MRRPWWSRLLTAVLALWLVLELGEPGIVHLAAMWRAGTTTMAGMSHDMHAGQAMAMGHGAEHHGHGGSTPEQTKCPCVGGCVSATALALVETAPATMLVAVLRPMPATEPVTVGQLPRPGPRYSRPYTTGPPRA